MPAAFSGESAAGELGAPVHALPPVSTDLFDGIGENDFIGQQLRGQWTPYVALYCATAECPATRSVTPPRLQGQDAGGPRDLGMTMKYDCKGFRHGMWP